MHKEKLAPKPRHIISGKRCRRLLAALSLALITSHCANNGGGNGTTPPPVGPGPATIVHNLEVRRHALTPLTNSEADRILEDSSRLLQTVDRDGDVVADVLLSRIGPLTSFVDPDGFINSSSDFRATCASGGQVFVVNEINWCDGIAPNIIGCADRPGYCLMVVRIAQADEGVLWAHEFGHNTGLHHRDSRFALMAPVLNRNNRSINVLERDALLNYSLLSAGGLLAPQREYVAQTGGGVSDGALPPVTDFVRQTFVRGVSYAQASRYTRADAELLLSLLENPDYAAHQANMIATISAVGESDHVDDVIRFFESGSGKLDRQAYEAKRAALFGLGYFAHAGAGPLAMDYLIASMDPSVWQARALDWSLPYQLSQAQQWEKLSEVAVLATALSGTPEAREALMALRTRSAASSVKSATESLPAPAVADDLLNQALEEHGKVSTQGLERYSQPH